LTAKIESIYAYTLYAAAYSYFGNMVKSEKLKIAYLGYAVGDFENGYFLVIAAFGVLRIKAVFLPPAAEFFSVEYAII